MKRTNVLPLSAILAACMLSSWANAGSTLFMAGSKATADGSAIVGATDDSGSMDMHQLRVNPKREGTGAWVYKDEGTGLEIEVPVAMQSLLLAPSCPSLGKGVNSVATVNESGISMTVMEDIRARKELIAADPYVPKGVAPSNAAMLVMPYIGSAREGAATLGALVETKGASVSFAAAFLGRGEIWYLEVYTGHQWAAVKLPDTAYAVVADDVAIDAFIRSDSENFMGSRNLFKLAADASLISQDADTINLVQVYGSEARDQSRMREWEGRRFFSPQNVGDYDQKVSYPLAMKPDHPIKIKEFFDLSRDRFERTKYSVDVAGAVPVRPIAVDNASMGHFFHDRKDRPMLFWVSEGNPAYSVYLPMYTNPDKVPWAYTVDSPKFFEGSAFWEFKILNVLASARKGKYAKSVRDHWNRVETDILSNIDAIDSRYEQSGRSAEMAYRLFKSTSDMALQDSMDLSRGILTKMAYDAYENAETN